MHAKLLDEHAQKDASATALLAHLRTPEPGDPAALAEQRWAFARISLQHMTTEEALVYGPLAADPRPYAAAAAARFKAELEVMHAHMMAHAEAWPQARIAREWDVYRHAAMAAIETVRDRMVREERGLYPFVATAQGDPTARPLPRNWLRDAFAFRERMIEN